MTDWSEEAQTAYAALLNELPAMGAEEYVRLMAPSHEPNGDYVETQRAPDASVKLSNHSIHYESPAGNENPLPAAVCTCGWIKRHARFKTVYQKALKHSNQTGHIMLQRREE